MGDSQSQDPAERIAELELELAEAAVDLATLQLENVRLLREGPMQWAQEQEVEELKHFVSCPECGAGTTTNGAQCCRMCGARVKDTSMPTYAEKKIAELTRPAPIRICDTCGNPENDHPYRHIFKPLKTGRKKKKAESGICPYCKNPENSSACQSRHP